MSYSPEDEAVRYWLPDLCPGVRWPQWIYWMGVRICNHTL